MCSFSESFLKHRHAAPPISLDDQSCLSPAVESYLTTLTSPWVLLSPRYYYGPTSVVGPPREYQYVRALLCHLSSNMIIQIQIQIYLHLKQYGDNTRQALKFVGLYNSHLLACWGWFDNPFSIFVVIVESCATAACKSQVCSVQFKSQLETSIFSGIFVFLLLWAFCGWEIDFRECHQPHPSFSSRPAWK